MQEVHRVGPPLAAWAFAAALVGSFATSCGGAREQEVPRRAIETRLQVQVDTQRRLVEEGVAERRRVDEASVRAQLEPRLRPGQNVWEEAGSPVDPFPERPLVLTLDGVDYRTRSRWVFLPTVATYEGEPIADALLLADIAGRQLYTSETGVDTRELARLFARLAVQPDDAIYSHTAKELWVYYAASLRREYRLAVGIRQVYGSGVLAADMEGEDGTIPADASYDAYFGELADAPPNALCLSLDLGLGCDNGDGLAFWARRAFDGTLDPAIEAMERILRSMGDEAFVEATAKRVAELDPQPRRYDEALEDRGPWPGLAVPTEAVIMDAHDATPDAFRTRAGERVTLSDPVYSKREGWTFVATTADGVAIRLSAAALWFTPRSMLKPATPFAQDGLLTVPSAPVALAFSPDGSRLALLDNRGDRLRVLDTRTGDTVWVKDVTERYYAGAEVAWAADGSALYVLINGTNQGTFAKVRRVPIDGGSIDDVLTLTSDFHASLAVVGSWLVVERLKWPYRAVLALDLSAVVTAEPEAPRVVASPTEVTDTAADMPSAVHPTRPIVAVPRADGVIVIDLVTGERKPTGHKGRPCYSRDGRWLVIGDLVFEVDDAGRPTAQTPRTLPVGDDALWLVGSGAARHIRAQDGVVRVFDLAGNEAVRAVSGRGPVAWSADGTNLVTTDGTDLQIWRLD